MATDKDLQNARELANLIKQKKKEEGDYNDLLKDSIQGLDKVSKQYEKINAAIGAAAEEHRDLDSLQKDLNKTIQQRLIVEGQLSNLIQNRSTIEEDLKKKQEDILSAIAKEKDLEEKLYQETAKLAEAKDDELDTQKLIVKSLEAKLALASKDVLNQKESISNEEAKYFALQQQLQIIKKQEDELQVQAAHQKMIADRIGITGAAMKGFTGVLEKMGVGSFLKMEEISKKMQETAEKTGNKWTILGAGMKQAFVSVGQALRDPVTMIGFLVKGVKELVSMTLHYQSLQFEVSKTMGVSVSQGKELLHTFHDITVANGKLAMTAHQLVETYSEMNNNLGFMGPQNAEFLTTTTAIQRRLGTSAESMQSLQLFAAQTGKSMQATYATVIGMSKETGARLKMSMSEKQVLEAVSKVSATIYNNFKGNLKELTGAVMTATKFGTTLDNIAAQGKALLDFESSISKEFEAQLMTGKDMDLSKARELALNHDINGLMKELNSKMMTSAEYNKMNVLQQESFAEALGMSREQMDEIYRKQELVKALGTEQGMSLRDQYDKLVSQGKSYDEISKLMGDKAVQDAMSASAQEKMTAAVERMKESIAGMTSGLQRVIDGFANIFSNATNIKIALGGIGVIMAGLAMYSLKVSAEKRQQLATDMQSRALNNQLLAIQIQKNARQMAGLTLGQREIVQNAANATTGAVAGGAKIVSQLGVFGIPIALGIIGGLLSMIPGGSASAAAPSVPPISPMNESVNNAKNTEKTISGFSDTGKRATHGGSTNVYVNVDALTGAKTVKTLTNDISTMADTSKIAAPTTNT